MLQRLHFMFAGRVGKGTLDSDRMKALD